MSRKKNKITCTNKKRLAILLLRSSSSPHLPESAFRKREREKERMRTFTSGVTTRARKRKVGQRDLWDLIVKNDDVSFKHILPRLNGTDLKFLYGVNSETRKLIKRSSRKGELKKSFNVDEMSSISTLEFAWENRSLWPRDWKNETYFCNRVAQVGARGEKV